MKTILTSIAAIVALSTAASAGGHRHHHHGHHHFHFKRHFYTPVYVAPPVKCHYVYKHGYAHKVCYKTGHSW